MPGMDTSSRSACPERVWMRLRWLPGHALPQAGRAEPQRLPRMQPSLLRLGRRADQPAPRHRHLRGMVRRPPARRPARVQRPPSLSRAGQGRAGTDRPERGGRRRPGIHQGNPDRLRHHRQQLHHGEHGLGRRREADPGHRGGDPAEAPPGDRLGLRRRCPDARGNLLADADGQGLDGAGAVSTRPAASSSAS